ncbi:MAG: hypothetical protein ACAH95_17015 [Fimbriimonas sp.]
MSQFPVKQFVNHLLKETGEDRVEVELADDTSVAEVALELQERGYDVIRDPFKPRITALRQSTAYSP